MSTENSPSPKSPAELTRMLRAWSEGSAEAESELWPIVYHELHRLARLVLIGRRRPVGPATTTLVHEAYLKLLGSEASFADRRHFYSVAARAMRFVLVDEARKRSAQKREEAAAVELGDELPDPLSLKAQEVLFVHQALERLAELKPRLVRLVELRFFVGLSVEETAEVMEVSRPTVIRDWKAARAFLHGELQAGG